MVSIDGEYSEIAETDCGTSVIAAGDTIYELSGVDLGSRELEVVAMIADDGDCLTDTKAPSTADCYRCAVCALSVWHCSICTS